MYNAFFNDAAFKQKRLARLRELTARGATAPSSKLMWAADKESGSLSGALAEEKDAARFVERTGVPLDASQWAETLEGALAKLLDATAAEAQGQKDFYLRWIEAIRPGANLGGVVPLLVHAQLADLASADGGIAMRMDASQRALCARLAKLWHASLAGGVTDAAEWREVRNRAVELADTLPDPWSAALAEFVASVAWPPTTLVDECLSPLQRLLHAQLSHARLSGMSVEQREEADHAADEPRRFRKAAEAPGFDMMAWHMSQAQPVKNPVMASVDAAAVEAARATAADIVIRCRMQLLSLTAAC